MKRRNRHVYLMLAVAFAIVLAVTPFYQVFAQSSLSALSECAKNPQCGLGLRTTVGVNVRAATGYGTRTVSNNIVTFTTRNASGVATGSATRSIPVVTGTPASTAMPWLLNPVTVIGGSSLVAMQFQTWSKQAIDQASQGSTPPPGTLALAPEGGIIRVYSKSTGNILAGVINTTQPFSWYVQNPTIDGFGRPRVDDHAAIVLGSSGGQIATSGSYQPSQTEFKIQRYAGGILQPAESYDQAISGAGIETAINNLVAGEGLQTGSETLAIPTDTTSIGITSPAPFITPQGTINPAGEPYSIPVSSLSPSPSSSPSGSPSPSPSSSPSPSPSPSPTPVYPNITTQSPPVIQPKTFGNPPNFVAYAVQKFSDRFPFDMFGAPSVSSAPACPSYVFFDRTFELCIIADIYSIVKYPAVIAFAIWVFLTL